MLRAANARWRRWGRCSSVACAAGIFLLAACGPAGAATYTYDALGRVTTVTYDDNSQVQYTYDAAGNRTQVTTTGAAGGGFTWSSTTPCTTSCWGTAIW